MFKLHHDCIVVETEVSVGEIESSTVNLEIFARILFSRLALKDILVTLKIATRA